MNYIKDCEDKLINYNSIDDRLEVLEKRLNKVSLAGCPKDIGAVDFLKIGKTNLKNDTLHEMIEAIHIKNKINALKEEKKIISIVLNKVKNESKELYDFLNYKYIKNLSFEKIAEKLGYSENSKRTLYNIKDRALENFCMYYWGEK